MIFAEITSLFFFGIVIIGAGIQIYRQPRGMPCSQMIEVFLSWACGVIIGIGGVIAFIGHTFLADQVAASIGWPAGNPFQQEVAMANLAIGILGILSVRISGTFRIATLIAFAVFMAGDGIIHILQMLNAHNMAVNNAGFVLYYDLIVPLVFLGLYLLGKYLQKNESHPSLY